MHVSKHLSIASQFTGLQVLSRKKQITENLKWITRTNFENVAFYEGIDHDLNFYVETKL